MASVSDDIGTVVSSPSRTRRDIQDVVEPSHAKQARLRVLLAEDQYLTREGTRRLLEGRDDLEVVGTASDYDSVIGEARRLQPDVVLMDVKMPPTYTMEGIEAAHRIRRMLPGTGIAR